jgi:hypothetical protein
MMKLRVIARLRWSGPIKASVALRNTDIVHDIT